MFYLKAREAHFQGKQMFFQTKKSKNASFCEKPVRVLNLLPNGKRFTSYSLYQSKNDAE